MATLSFARSLLVGLGSIFLTSSMSAQDPWSDDELVKASADFESEDLPTRLNQLARLIGDVDRAYPALCARIHGDHREYLLKIERLLDGLAAERWPEREEAERTLVEIGARAKSLIERRVTEYEVYEQSVRAARILRRIADRGTADQDREIALLRGFVRIAAFTQGDERMLRALKSALGHTDPLVVEGALRALGTLGKDDDADVIHNMLEWKSGIYRRTVLGALPEVAGARSLELCRELLFGDKMSIEEQMAMIVRLRQRDDGGELLKKLAAHPNALIKLAVQLEWPPAGSGSSSTAQLTLANRDPLDATFLGIRGDTFLVGTPVEGLARSRITFAESDIIDFPGAKVEKAQGVRVFLNQGSLFSGELLSLDPMSVKVRSPIFGDLSLERSAIQGLAIDPELDRLVGASTKHDRVRLKDNTFIDGKILRLTDGRIVINVVDDGEKSLPFDQVAGLLMTRPLVSEPGRDLFTRVDLVSGDRLLGHVAASSETHLGLVVPGLGGAVLPNDTLSHLELGVGGGALWGFTLVADYSDNRIVEVDEKGNEVFVLEEIYGAWDVECLDNNNLLITEFSVSRVQEVDRKNNVIWSFEDLKNPYDADRLQNGNTLIADTFGGRVIEVDPKGKIVWSFEEEIRPFDVDRLQNGNTLIADVLKDRVLEVAPDGTVVWEAKNMPNVHDADRLPNGNTLVTLRTLNKVVEINRDGEVVFAIPDLFSPSDADRLPNGHTLIAENGAVRRFDRRGNEVWKREMTWAVEVNQY